MKRPIFEIKQSPTGSYYFTFKPMDEATHVISGSFPDRAKLERCLSKTRDAAIVAEICNLDEPLSPPPLFIIRGTQEGFMFSLLGYHNEIIFSSTFYADKEKCWDGIKSIKASAQRAAIVDLTVE